MRTAYCVLRILGPAGLPHECVCVLRIVYCVFRGRPVSAVSAYAYAVLRITCISRPRDGRAASGGRCAGCACGEHGGEVVESVDARTDGGAVARSVAVSEDAVSFASRRAYFFSS